MEEFKLLCKKERLISKRKCNFKIGRPNSTSNTIESIILIRQQQRVIPHYISTNRGSQQCKSLI